MNEMNGTFISQYGQLILNGILAASTISFGILTYRKNDKIASLEAEKEYLKKEIHKVTSNVDPESDRKLLMQARVNVKIMGINSLAPLHHCREEIIKFLKKRKGALFVLVLDPGSEAFKRREEHECDACQRILTEWLASMSILKDIQKRSQGGIKLRLHQDSPSRSLFMIDTDGGLNDRSKMLINYYPNETDMRGYSGAQFLAEFIQERDRDSMFKNLMYYSDCWDRARELSIDDALEAGKRTAHG